MPLPSPIHPALVHFPVALILVSLLFTLIGRALDRDWWRKAAAAMLVLGVLGLVAAYLTGGPAGDAAEKLGVAEQAVDDHEKGAVFSLWFGIATVVAMAAAGRVKKAAAALGGLALLLHFLTAATVSVTAYRGGKLVFEHGAAVKVNGQPVTHAKPGEGHGEREPGEKD